MDKLSIVIPVYYNADSLAMVYDDLKAKVFTRISNYEIVMVDDGSGDNSWEVMQQLHQKDERIKLLKLSRNFGSHEADLAGILNCTGDCVVTKGADLQEDSSIILEMYEKWKKGNKVVLAVRASREESFLQKKLANTYYEIMQKVAFPQMPDGGFDCYLIDRKVIEVLRMLDERNSATTLQILWSGFKTDIVYYTRLERTVGKSRWTLRKKLKLVMDSVISFSDSPIHIMTSIGGLFFLFSIIWSVWLIIDKLLGKIPIEGWTTLMVIVLFTSSIIMLMLGILGEYIWRALDAARNRPPFIVDEVIEGKKDTNE